MDEDQTPPSSPVIFYKPTWQESPLFVLDLIENADIVEMKNGSYEFWERVYRNVEVFERAILRCLELRDMLILETVVNRLSRPDSEVKQRMLLHAQNWPDAKTFLEHVWCQS